MTPKLLKLCYIYTCKIIDLFIVKTFGIMDHFKFCKVHLIMLVIFSPLLVNGQNDTIIAFSENINQPEAGSIFNDSLFRHLPFTGSTDIFQLNPVIYRNENYGERLIDGFYTSGDYTWFDGIPMNFTEEMPLRLIGQARFNDFSDYLRFGNSMTGFAALEPVKPSDSLSFLVETSTRMIYKKFNDADLQVLLAGPLIKQTTGKSSRSLLSFTVAGRLSSSSDSDPSCGKA